MKRDADTDRSRLELANSAAFTIALAANGPVIMLAWPISYLVRLASRLDTAARRSPR